MWWFTASVSTLILFYFDSSYIQIQASLQPDFRFLQPLLMVLGLVMEIDLLFVLNLVMVINLLFGSSLVIVLDLASRKTPAHR